MDEKTKLAIIGGTGKSGKYLVQQLITQGYQFKLLLRNPKKLEAKIPLVEIVSGDVQDYNAILSLLEGCDVVISTLGFGQPPSEPSIFSQSTNNVIRAMDEHKLRRYIVTTGLNVDTPFDKKDVKSKFATEWMKTNYPKSTADKQTEYEILSSSKIDWTLVRLPLIEQTDSRTEVKISLEDCPGDKIGATDLAHFLIEQLSDNRYVRKAPFIANV